MPPELPVEEEDSVPTIGYTMTGFNPYELFG